MMKKWFWRILAFLIIVPLLFLGGIVLSLLNPAWWYDQETEIEGIRLHHQQALGEDWEAVMVSAAELVQTSELYDPEWPLQVCVDDGSLLPRLWNRLMGPAFGFGYANVVVLGSQALPSENRAMYVDRAWELDRLLAHEMVHCYQFHAFGLETQSTPIWQHEGYAEFISKSSWPYDELFENVSWYQKEISEHPGDNWLILPSGIGVPTEYYHHYLLVNYWMKVQGLTYRELLAQHPDKASSVESLDAWYAAQKEILNFQEGVLFQGQNGPRPK